MDNVMPFVWLGVVVLSVVVEISTVSLVSIWFMPSALVAMILAFCGVPLWIQILVFLILSILCIFLMKPLSKKLFGVKHVATNVDSLIGEEAVVIEDINNLEARGQVKVRGQIWTARSADKDAVYAKGDVLNVIAIEGVKLICKKSADQ
ncbi:MAG: NfeD family protein [Clostridia bacterium]|nr:NfeD family protein [Clostridia bacterium]